MAGRPSLSEQVGAAFSPTRNGFPKLQLAMPSMPVRLPRKLRLRRIQKSPSFDSSSTITSLTYSFNPADTWTSLRRHKWVLYDLQYLLMAIIAIFSLSIIESPGAVVKAAFAAGLTILLATPITRQFFLPFLPIASWLVLFYACQFVTGEHRPGIWVRVLPALENILYGANLSNILSAHRNTFLDVLAWLPYGITHFGAPFVCSALMFVFAPPGTTPIFARAFGYMNLIGVLIQIFFPCSPPWYENKYGLAPANYSMPGSPAGLAAIDKLFGIDLYTSTFTASPMVFGAFPSLHSGSATIEALFMSHTFPRLKPFFTAYALWLWWATMYLSHHYAIDLVAGSFIACITYFVTKANFLPRLQPDKIYRWQYEYVEVGEVRDLHADAYTPVLDEESYPLQRRESDEWTIGSSSSYASPETPRPSSARESWDGDTLASAQVSDNEWNKY